MKRTAIIFLIVLLTIGLVLPGSALAAKKKKKGDGDKKDKDNSSQSIMGTKTRMFDSGVDLGLPAFGYLGLGTIKYTANDKDQSIDFSGSGTVSFPYLGAHFSLYPAKTWYLQFGLGMIHQSGQVTLKSDDQPDLDGDKVDWGVNAFRLDAGIGKIFGSYAKIRPKAGAGLGILYTSYYFDKGDWKDETFAGWTVAPFGLLGVDFDVYQSKGWGDIFAGINLRGDLIYSLAPLEYSGKGDATMTCLWFPISLYLSGGLRF